MVSVPAPAEASRYVLLIAGPPGAGKSTLAYHLAATYGLDVYDLDAGRWGTEARFVQAIAALRADPDARAVVIRSGARRRTRARWAHLIGATTTLVLDTPPATCRRRILRRARPVPPLEQQLAAVDSWHARYEPDPTTLGPASRRW